MAAHFDLVVTADHPSLTADFRLLDAHGAQLAFRQVDFKTIAAGRLHGLFDLRNYLRHYVEEGKEAAAVAEIGVCLAEEVLGPAIFAPLWDSESQRTLRIQLPGATEEANHLAAALARVPWEIARPRADQPTLGERNLLVRVVHDMRAPASQPVELASDECLRVLFVFAEARGSRPLGARRERRDLLQMLRSEVYPTRRVEAHFLTHGVTRERLEAQIREHGGYHIVHWSGHGNLNLLELAKVGGGPDHLSGEQLLGLFTKRSGGFLPRLFFLSACHSGDILRVRDWNDFLAVAQGREPGTKDADARPLDLGRQPGFTGTAHSLLQGGVPSVVAMRYAVGDDYARELAVEFYRALLAHARPKDVAASLTLARQAMRDGNKHNSARFAACDHATPVLFGAEQPGLTLAPGRSPDLNPRDRRLHRIPELSTASHAHFVGRTWQLAGLGADFIGSGTGAEVRPVALITGLGGMGKTALVAEALSLWETRFNWVLLYQAKPNALGFEASLCDIHLKLMGELQLYHAHVKAHPADAIYRDADGPFTGDARLERLTRNLLRALRDEALLLVLDNFETNLKPTPDAADATAAASQDPAWDRCLALLAAELPVEIDGRRSPSRVLITCRRPLAALAGGAAFTDLLGPLPPPEAALYLRAHPALEKMVFGGDAQERLLAQRLLNASRFHPLLMDRLARLAAEPTRREQLLQALDTLEQTKDFARLPSLFATRSGDARELAYLDDALATSLDQLIRAATPDARRLLWMIALANEPVALGLLQSVWTEESHERQMHRMMKRDLGRLSELSPDHQAYLTNLPPEVRAQLDALPPEPTELLSQLLAVGLATEVRTGPEDKMPDLACHELVRERIRAWMERQPQDRGEFTENDIRLDYAERLVAVFKALQHQNMTAAMQVGSRAFVYCVQAEAWVQLGGLASDVVTGTSDPRLLEGLIPHLRTAAESAPNGPLRWRFLNILADALSGSGHPDLSLLFHEQAATLARAAAEAGSIDARQAWFDLGWITGNWANALMMTGHPNASRQRQLEAAEAHKQAGRPDIMFIMSEMEALRIDIRQSRVDEALPEIELRLAQVDAWWRRYRSGLPVPEAGDAETLERALIGALDVATEADFRREDWLCALRRLDTTLEVKRAARRAADDIGFTRMNRAAVLIEIPGRFGEARTELEACLSVFANDPGRRARVLSSLAALFEKQGDVVQAITQARRALALLELLPEVIDRAISHNNLANYLERLGTQSARDESPRHRLAALIYRLVAGLGQQLETSLHNYAIDYRRAHLAGIELVVPRVAQLVTVPAFAPVEQWIRQRGVDVAQLQSEVREFLAHARQHADKS